MPVRADHASAAITGMGEADMQQKADMLALQGQVAELKAIVAKGIAAVDPTAAVTSYAIPTADRTDDSSPVTESPPFAPMLDDTLEPDDTRGPLKDVAPGVAIKASAARDRVDSYML